MLTRIRTAVAVVASSAAHLAVILVAARGASAAHPPHNEPSLSSDSWIGETFEVGLTPLSVGGQSEQASQAPAQTQASGSEPEPFKGSTIVATPEPSHAAPASPATSRTQHKPPARRPSLPAASGSSSTSPVDKPSGAREEGGSAGGAGSFGMHGPGHGGPRELARAFTRAIPVAVSADPVWGTLPMGPAGFFDLKIAVGEDGRIVSAVPDGAVSEHFRVVASRTVAMLGAGTFAIRAEPGAGLEVLRIGASISSVDSSPPDDRSSAGAYGLGFEPPMGEKPGKAHFTLRSGRHVEISVRVLRVQ